MLASPWVTSGFQMGAGCCSGHDWVMLRLHNSAQLGGAQLVLTMPPRTLSSTAAGMYKERETSPSTLTCHLCRTPREPRVHRGRAVQRTGCAEDGPCRTVAPPPSLPGPVAGKEEGPGLDNGLWR